ncbi:MAG TPA: GspH/FimT family pseudopilin [Rhizobacter sp.]
MRTGSAAARGFTLIEMMATVAVAGVVMTAAVPSLHGWVDQQRLKGVAGELSSDLQHARTEALLRNEGVRISFGGNACYVVHTGAADRCRCDADGSGRCDDGTAPIKTVALPTARGIALQANVRSVLFAPEHGTATPAATLRLQGAQGRTVQHTVNLMGRVRSCAAQGAVTGYSAC